MMSESIDQRNSTSQILTREPTTPPPPARLTPTEVSRPATSKSARSERRETILNSAAQMFAEFGYRGASLRDISSAAGISHPGLLHHFESKSVLLNGVIDRLEERAQIALSRAEELSTSPHSLLQGLAEIWNPASHSMQLLAMLYADSVSDDHPGRYRMARLRRVHEHVLEQCFTAFSNRGLLRDDVDPSFASRVMLDHILGHAVRERTVRTMQSESHDDSPLADLTRLTSALLVRDW